MITYDLNPDNGLILYSINCDGSNCEESLPPRSSESVAIVDAAAAGWLMRRPERKFSGVARMDYCPKCRKKDNVRNGLS